MTVGELLRTPNFGRLSLKDLLSEIECFLSDHIRDRTVQPNSDTRLQSDRSEGTAPQTPQLPIAWVDAAQTLGPLFAAATELTGVRTVGDALSAPVADLARKMGMSANLGAIPVDTLAAGRRGPVSVVLERLESVLNAMPETRRLIVEHRLVRNPQRPRMTLGEVGSLVGLTRERIRRLQIRGEGQLAHELGRGAQLVSSVLREELAPVVDARAFDQHVDAVLGTGHMALAMHYLRTALVAEMGYTRRHGAYVDGQAQHALIEIKNRARELADDAGLVKQSALLADFPDQDWRRQHWSLLSCLAGLHEIHGSLAIRDSAKAKAKAALNSIGRPATREEVAHICGLSVTQTAGAFSNIPSVVRADPERWGLKDWVDDEYDGIVGEIIQRIEENGGATTTERLLSELPAKFNVSPASVRAYMQTPRFAVRDGSISLASPASIRLRDFDDVVHGHDESGAPYWTFVVEDRYFHGYSVVGVPPEFAKALGCEPDSAVDVRVENLPACRALSLRWNLASLTGASLGYLAKPLRLLELQPGDRARVAIVGPRSATLGPEDGTAGRRPAREADAKLARMLARRRAV
ncbi:MAG: hypothetical protein OXH09_09365 [Gammaproteobacteria bacterium]|nr:hypothetical protein [Gammaproteobacteria bacterium]